MKAFINKKVWDLPSAVMEQQNHAQEYQCLANKETVTKITSSDFTVDFEVPLTCCNKKLHKYLAKMERKNQRVTFVILVGTNTEVTVTGFLTRNIMFFEQFQLQCSEAPKFKELIDWEDVENA